MPITGAWYTRFSYTDPVRGPIVSSLTFPTDALSMNVRRIVGKSTAESGATEELLVRLDYFVTLAWVARPRTILDELVGQIQYMGSRQIALTLDYQGTHDTGSIFHFFNTWFTKAELQQTEVPLVPVNPKGSLFSATVTYRQGV